MSCCMPGVRQAAVAADPANRTSEILLASRTVADGLRQTDLSVPGIHCGGCIQKIENALGALAGVEAARVNLSTRRVSIRWRVDAEVPPFISTLDGLGYPAHLYDTAADNKDDAVGRLVRALAVAGFAASNIMLLSVSVWSGADAATRDVFHWLSAVIAFGALAYSGRIFFLSAWNVLKRGHTNMDVPISIGVLLAFGMSLYETVHHGQHAYFDAAVSLLFFLLIGRTLDHMMRRRARTAVTGLAKLAARGALTVQPDGTRLYLPVEEIKPGMTILVAAGERIPVDARVVTGRSEVDCSLLTGESEPQIVVEGRTLRAGMLNVTAPLTVVATAVAQDSFVAEMIRLMEAAEAGRSSHRGIADRAARLYAPTVHFAAAITFIGWLLATGDLYRAMTIAVAVLIITCPCALGLAVPMVQVVAAHRLFDRGIFLKDGSALERLAEVNSVVFDKTGTLTLGTPWLANRATIDSATLRMAGAIAEHSRHPYSLALAAAVATDGDFPVPSSAVSETPGSGLEARLASGVYRLGRPAWALDDVGASDASVVLARDGKLLAAFDFGEKLRQGAAETVASLRCAQLPVEILSGDRDDAVRTIAEALKVSYRPNMAPADKTARIRALENEGRKVLMVGDGVNDAPALVAAHVSMAPASAADIGRNAADLVFLHETLLAVPEAIRIARAASHLVRQNLTLAVVYNAIALPVAVLGYVTPLVAAIAMSLSSVIVVANALRLRGGVSGRAPGSVNQAQLASGHI